MANAGSALNPKPLIEQGSSPEFQIEVTSLRNPQLNENTIKGGSTSSNQGDSASVSKPLCDFEGYSTEWREIAEQIVKEIVPKSLGVKWTDCIGLDAAQEVLKEAAVYPLKYPELFNGLIAPWRGSYLLSLALSIFQPGQIYPPAISVGSFIVTLESLGGLCVALTTMWHRMRRYYK